ncbi:MAG: aminotransferase class III-fold pyridoxal phosphate-dependent enzyme [Mesorhizobium sp.]|uniref:aminotransferase n=1 Tax=Mesorhizobium sp. TaxID=1871066 RepID=UPI000FE5D129|nr:aminotransferase [Mesorhizobium sp.]RWE82201.1 MAG: aminotransferase class III-fold pyridoxal phosphate-dependent enzyme [Mesorhizobium sp.]TJW65774.1 MAG: aminotransferase class III-fold pyridoxal phosphate-dependent enzyme [Mesorhizobium sp.]
MATRPNSIEARDIASQLHSFTNPDLLDRDGPIVVAKGEGIRVFGADGKPYIEGMSGLWAASLGFSNHRLVDAARRQLETLPSYHTFYRRTSPVVTQLAEALVEMTPAHFTKAFFTTSGSEGNESAIKMAWAYHHAMNRAGRKKVISRLHAYHGGTIVAASLTGMPTSHAGLPMPLDWIIFTDCPHHSAFSRNGESEDEFVHRLAMSLDDLIQREGPDTIAAFIAEPVMAAGGVIVPPKSYFPAIRNVLDKYDILLIVDEIVCGFYRTGQPFGSQTFDIKADMMVLAKGLSASYQPIAAVMLTERIHDAIRSLSNEVGAFSHGFTYSGHPVAAAVALEAITIYREDGFSEHVKTVSAHFQARLRSFRDHPSVDEVRGVGLIGGIELRDDATAKRTGDPSQTLGAVIADRALDHGLVLRSRGNLLAFCPPLIITPEEVDEMFDRFSKAICDVLEQ